MIAEILSLSEIVIKDKSAKSPGKSAYCLLSCLIREKSSVKGE